MASNRVKEIEHELTILKSHNSYINSVIALLMAETAIIDNEIEALIVKGQENNAKIKDLEAELKDTV